MLHQSLKRFTIALAAALALWAAYRLTLQGAPPEEGSRVEVRKAAAAPGLSSARSTDAAVPSPPPSNPTPKPASVAGSSPPSTSAVGTSDAAPSAPFVDWSTLPVTDDLGSPAQSAAAQRNLRNLFMPELRRCTDRWQPPMPGGSFASAEFTAILEVSAEAEGFLVERVEEIKSPESHRSLVDCISGALNGLHVPMTSSVDQNGALNSLPPLAPGTHARLSFPTRVGKRLPL